MGVRSNTNVYLVYMEGIVYPELVAKIEERLEGFEIDGVLDSGVIEQLSEENGIPRFHSFRRRNGRTGRQCPSLTAEWLCCRTIRRSRSFCRPITIPFIKTSDDYYNRWEIASFERLLRYFASFCHDIAGPLSGGHQFPHTDSADHAPAVLCGRQERRAVSGGD